MGYKKIEGSIFNPEEITGKNIVNFASQVAQMLLKIHSIKISDELKESGLSKTDYSQKTLEGTWEKASGWVKKNFSEKEFNKAKNLWRDIIEFFETKPQENVLVQGDSWYGNIILDENYHIRGIVDFDKVSIGDHAIDFVVQEYVSIEFMAKVINEYKKLGGRLGDDFEKRVKFLKGIKAIEDLNFCLHINFIYSHIPKRVRESILVD